MKQPCGCCSGIEVITPEPEANRPGLPALVYRAGTHASFLESMIARLTSHYIDIPIQDGSGNFQRLRPLAGLSTREPGDPSLALLDAWATVADVLTFYQERIANEGYLRTATERQSILELSRLIGYKLRPAVSASVYLAFTVAAGFNGDVPAGTRAQSIPGSGEKSQFFETSDDLPARDVWNNLKPRLTRPQTFTISTGPGTDLATRETIYFQGIASNLNPGDALILILGDGENQQALRKVKSVDVQTAQQRTEVRLEQPPMTSSGSTPFDEAHSILQPFMEEGTAIFADVDLAQQIVTALETLLDNIQSITVIGSGSQAAAMVEAAVPQVQEALDVATRRRFTRLKPWLSDLLDAMNLLVEQLPGTRGISKNGSGIKALSGGLLTSALENLFQIAKPLALAPSLQPANALHLNRTVTATFTRQADVAPRILAAFHPEIAPALYKAWSGVETPELKISVGAARVKAGLFASTFAGQATVKPFGTPPPSGTTVSFAAPTIDSAWIGPVNGTKDDQLPSAVALDSTYDRIIAGTWVAIDRPSADGRIITYHQVVSTRTQAMDTQTGFTAKVTLLTLNPPWLSDTASALASVLGDNNVLRGTIVYAQAEELDLAEEPLDNDIEGAKIELDELYDGLEAGRWIIVSGERTDIPNTTGVQAAELVMVAGVTQGAQPLFCVDFPLTIIPFSDYAYTTDANQYGDRLVVGYVTNANLQTVRDGVQKLVDSQDTESTNTFNQQFCDQVQLAHRVYANAYVPT